MVVIGCWLGCTGSVFLSYLGSIIDLGSDWPGMETAKVFIGREAKEHGIWCLGLHAFLPQACVSPGLGRPHREPTEVHAQVSPWSCLWLFLFETGDVVCVCPHVSCQSYSPFKSQTSSGRGQQVRRLDTC